MHLASDVEDEGGEGELVKEWVKGTVDMPTIHYARKNTNPLTRVRLWTA